MEVKNYEELIRKYKSISTTKNKRISNSIKHDFTKYKAEKEYEEKYPSFWKNLKKLKFRELEKFLKKHKYPFIITGSLIAIVLAGGFLAPITAASILTITTTIISAISTTFFVGSFFYNITNKKTKIESYKKKINEKLESIEKDIKNSQTLVDYKMKELEIKEKLVEKKLEEIKAIKFSELPKEEKTSKIEKLNIKNDDLKNEINDLKFSIQEEIKNYIKSLNEENQIKSEIISFQKEKGIKNTINLNEFSELEKLLEANKNDKIKDKNTILSTNHRPKINSDIIKAGQCENLSLPLYDEQKKKTKIYLF